MRYPSTIVLIAQLAGLSVALTTCGPEASSRARPAADAQPSAAAARPTTVTTANSSRSPSAAATTLDIAACTPGIHRIDGPQGSTTIFITGRSVDVCELRWGAEIENPAWNHALDHMCAVPISTGTIALAKSPYAGADMSPLSGYCSVP